MKPMHTIKNTKDYNWFKLFDSNRQVDKNHLKRLVASIKSKNLLYLFPIVINGNREVIDGQHRLAAARELNVPVYYLIDNNVTKADIAMVNNNRKGWVTIDFINFYKKEGNKAYKKVSHLITTYKISVMAAVRLCMRGIASYYTGGNLSINVRSGNIDDSDFKLDKHVCEISLALKSHCKYAIAPAFLLDIKYVFMKYDIHPDAKQINKVSKLIHLFPKEITDNDYYSVRNILKEILSPKDKGHTKSEVEAIMNKHNVK